MLNEILDLGLGDCSLCGLTKTVRTYNVSPDKLYNGSFLSREDLLTFYLCRECRDDIIVAAEENDNERCVFRVVGKIKRFAPTLKQTTTCVEHVCIDIKFKLPPDHWDNNDDDWEEPTGEDDPVPTAGGGARKNLNWN